MKFTMNYECVSVNGLIIINNHNPNKEMLQDKRKSDFLQRFNMILCRKTFVV